MTLTRIMPSSTAATAVSAYCSQVRLVMLAMLHAELPLEHVTARSVRCCGGFARHGHLSGNQTIGAACLLTLLSPVRFGCANCQMQTVPVVRLARIQAEHRTAQTLIRVPNVQHGVCPCIKKGSKEDLHDNVLREQLSHAPNAILMKTWQERTPKLSAGRRSRCWCEDMIVGT